MFRGIGVAGVLVCSLLSVLHARAQSAQRFSLNWVREAGAESCIASRDLALVVQNAFGPVFVLPDQADHAIEGRIRKEGAAWQARIAVSDRAGAVLGVRELASSEPSCAAINAQLVLVIALAIDPEIALDGLPPELLDQLGAPSDAAAELLAELRAEQAAKQAAKPEPQAPAIVRAPAAGPAPTAAPPAARSTESHPRFGAFAQLGFSGELLPSYQPVLGFGLELHLARRFSVHASGLWSAPSIMAVDGPTVSPGSVRFDLWIFSLAACAAPVRTKALRLSACAGAGLLARSIEARGFSSASDPSRVEPTAVLGATLVYSGFAPFVASLGAALHVPFDRTRFSYRVPGSSPVELSTSSIAGFVTVLGVGVTL